MKKGIWITIIVIAIFMVLMAVAAGLIYMQFTSDVDISNDSLLEIELNSAIPDMTSPAGYGPAAFGPKPITMKDYWYHIKKAKIDNKIKAIVLKISNLPVGFSKVEELGRYLEDFKKSGKKVYAYIEGGGIREYYIATFADKIYVFKGNNLFLRGLSIEALFLRNTLSKLGIEADVFHIGEYKTAMHMFSKDHMTDAHRESYQRFLDDTYNYTLKQIAIHRNVDESVVKKIFDESPISNDAYLEAKLIDKAIYKDELLKDSRYKWISFKKYKKAKSPNPFKGDDDIAIIFASGEIHSGKSGGQSLFGGEVMGSATVAKQLERARKNKNIKAVVLRVDSPGGSAVASEEIRREAELLAKEKPLVISMSNLAASGGYWISMASHKIVALPQTITGSIGVVGAKFVLKGFYDKIGVNKEILKTSKYADMFSDYKPFDEDERKKMGDLMYQYYDNFLEIVKNNRKDFKTKEDVNKVARGRIWTGVSALELNLVDELGGLNTAINEAKKLAKIPENKDIGIRIYPKQKTPMEIFMDLMEADARTSDPVKMLETKVKMYDHYFPACVLPYQINVK